MTRDAMDVLADIDGASRSPATETIVVDGLEMTFTMTPGPDTAPWPPPQSALDHTHRAMVEYLRRLTPGGARRHRNRCHRCNLYGNPLPSAGHFKPGPKAARMRGRRWRS